MFKGVKMKSPLNKVPIQPYQANWSWDHKTHYWLLKQIKGETVLNFPCGQSRIGFRADAVPEVSPDLIADLNEPLKYFQPLMFDTIICDPPWDYYNKIGWCHDLAKIAKLRIIFSSPPMSVHLKKRDWIKSYHLTEKFGSRFIRIWQIFDRRSEFIMDPTTAYKNPEKGRN